MTELTGLTKEEVIKKIDNLFPTQYERTHKIRIIKKELCRDTDYMLVWKIHKSDNTVTLVYSLKLGLSWDKYTHLIFISANQIKALEELTILYHEIDNNNKVVRRV